MDTFIFGKALAGLMLVVSKVQLGHRVHRVFKACRDFRVFKVRLEQQALRAHKVQQG
jgi:hypothetical protein